MTIGPVGERERVAELDILRGVALFGVLTMNFVGFASAGVIATEAQLAALPTAAIDDWVYAAVRWLIGDKANTAFATLFGLGFYLQLNRASGKPGFEKIYARRLFWLLVFGWLNALFLWVWDILNLYALAGFALLAMRHWRTRTLVIIGVIAALYSYELQEWTLAQAGVQLIPDSLYDDAAVLARQSVVLYGSYGQIVAEFARMTWAEWIVGGALAAWFVYALGRFALGAAIGRSGILDDLDSYRPLLRRIAWIALPSGLALALLIQIAIVNDWRIEPLAHIMRSPVALLLSAGYAAAIVTAVGSEWGRHLFGIFAPVGRMALTNYLMQGLIYGFVLFGIGPGLGLAGRIGSATVVLVCIAFFAFQIGLSQWWLARYRFGPMEWLWRWLTYGERPAMGYVVASQQ